MGKRGGKNRRKAEEEGGEGGEEKPSAAPGPTVEISQGGFADKRKYRLDDDTASYFKEIAKVLATSEEAKDPEQRAMLVSNALGEALGKELSLSMDPDCSRIVQTLIKGASPDEVLAYLSAVGSGGRVVVLVTNPFGSHVVEDLLRTLGGALSGVPPPPQGFNSRLRSALEPLCEAFAEHIYDLAAHRSASPVLRTLLKLLSGEDLGPSTSQEKGGNLKKKVAGAAPSSAAATDGGAAAAPPPKPEPRFPKLLKNFISGALERLEASGEYWEFTADPAGCAFLQGVASAATFRGGPEAVLPRLLGAPVLDDPAEDDGHFSLVDPNSLRALLRCRCGSRLAEAILRESPAPLRREFARRFLAGRLSELSAHPAANFVVQAYLAEMCEDDEVEAALVELGPTLGELLATSRGGVVAALVAAAARRPNCQKAGAKALARALMTRFGGAGAKEEEGAADDAAAAAKAKAAYVSVLAPALLRLGAGSAAGPHALTRHGFSVLGCVTLASVLRLPAPASQQFADSVAALPPDELAAAAADPSASRALESFLQGSAPVGLKRKMMLGLTGKWGALGVDPVGAHVVESAYNAADVRGREAIVAEVADNETAVAVTRHGPVLLGKLGASHYKRDPAAWRKGTAAGATVRAAFADILADGPAPAAGKKEGDAGGGDKAAKKEKKRKHGAEEEAADGAGGRGAGGATTSGREAAAKGAKKGADDAAHLGGKRVDAVFELLGIGADFGGGRAAGGDRGAGAAASKDAPAAGEGGKKRKKPKEAGAGEQQEDEDRGEQRGEKKKKKKQKSDAGGDD